MRGWAAALLLMALVAAASAPAVAQICKISDGRGGTVEYPCSAASDTPAKARQPAWYERGDVQFGLGALGILGSAGAAVWGVFRVRQRRQTLTDYISAVETTYSESKGAPESGVPKLVNLRMEVRARHERGRLEDAQYLELDKRITDYIVRLRLLELDRRFHGLPHALLNEVRHHVADGSLSRSEADLIDLHAATHHVDEKTRGELAAIVRGWAREDERQPKGLDIAAGAAQSSKPR